MDKDLEERIAKSTEYFMQGFGCCQSVLLAFADIYRYTPEQAKQIGAGFGGGIGKLRMICGAVSAMVILAGMDSGQTDGADRMGKADCYRLVQELLAKSKEQNGSIICAELLGISPQKAEGNYIPSERTAEYYKKRPCVAKVECAARIFAEYLQAQRDR